MTSKITIYGLYESDNEEIRYIMLKIMKYLNLFQTILNYFITGKIEVGLVGKIF
jgi:hypothetical protein